MTTAGDDGHLPVGTVTFLRTDVEGSMGLPGRLGRRWDDLNAPPPRADPRRAVEAHGGTSSGPRATPSSRRSARPVRRGRGRGRRPTRDGRRAVARRGDRSASGWGSTPARPTWPATTTAASTSTARPGSPRPGTAARSSCRRPPPTLVADRLPERRDPASTSASTILRDVPRPERLAQLSIAGLPTPSRRCARPAPVRGQRCPTG